MPVTSADPRTIYGEWKDLWGRRFYLIESSAVADERQLRLYLEDDDQREVEAHFLERSWKCREITPNHARSLIAALEHYLRDVEKGL